MVFQLIVVVVHGLDEHMLTPQVIGLEFLAGRIGMLLQVVGAQLADHDIQAHEIAVLVARDADAFQVLVHRVCAAHLFLKLAHLLVDLAVLNGQPCGLHLFFADRQIDELLLGKRRDIIVVGLPCVLVGDICRGLLDVHRHHAVQAV